MILPTLGSIPSDFFAAGSNVATGELAQMLDTVPDLITAHDAGRLVIGPFRMALNGTAVHRYVHRGPSATIAWISSVIDGALTTGNATLTAVIGVTAVTGGVVTITQSGSAAGDVDGVQPSALNVLATGDVLKITVGGTNDAARVADVFVHLTY